MSTRIHVVIEPRERDAFHARARAEGQSLSEWLRQAGRDRLARDVPKRIRSRQDLRKFFDECAAHEVGREPDWSDHVAVIDRSRAGSIELT